MKRVAVIGAGYAGLAAAVELAAAGIPVTVFEASRTLGGRARSVEIEGIALDNGQHILSGAYRETLRLMEMVGAAPQRLLLRQSLLLEYPGEFRIAAPQLPAPLHLAAALLCAKGISWLDKWAAIRFMRKLKATNFRLAHDLPLADLLAAERQSPRVRGYLWEPLCVAALNTPTEYASSQIFANVLRDSLAAARVDSDLLLPLTDLTQLFPQPAEQFIDAHGGAIKRGVRVEHIRFEDAQFRINEEEDASSHVILAVAPYHLAAFATGLPALAEAAAQVTAFSYEPIVTAYLAYPESVRLPQPMLGHADGNLQWLFDRGQLGGPVGLLAAVISARGRHQDLPPDQLVAQLHEEIRGILPNLPAPLWSRVIVEKRATFACTPGLVRPAMQTPQAGLLLAGDYIASDYPATIESAVRSGINAAKQISELS